MPFISDTASAIKSRFGSMTTPRTRSGALRVFPNRRPKRLSRRFGASATGTTTKTMTGKSAPVRRRPIRASSSGKIPPSGKTTTCRLSFGFVPLVALKYQCKAMANAFVKKAVRQLLGPGIPSHDSLLTLLQMRMLASNNCSKWRDWRWWTIA